MENEGRTYNMIPYNFDYYVPETTQEAIQLFRDLIQEGKSPMYFSGGTEIITLGRLNVLSTDAVIDLKDIPEYRELYFKQGELVIGGGQSLVDIERANMFPMLSATVRDIADHTARTKITVGGNICGNIYYREAVLPFLVTDSTVVIAKENRIEEIPINQIFQEQLKLSEGEFLLQLKTDQRFIEAPFVHIKRRRQWYTGYPLITIVSLKIGGQVRIAISGLYPYPFRSEEMEQILNQSHLPLSDRVNQAVHQLPSPFLTDTEGSSEYRLFVLKNVLLDILLELERG